ncbi:hypothetical protein LINPERHAP1_LOCUS36269, partial [Linum perenne]
MEGVELTWEAKLMGDDSWLVECGSEENAMRIVRKEDWHFRGAKVEVKAWFPGAGRSNRLEIQGVKWLLVFGLPVHCRSEKVFKIIEDYCGGFVEGEDTGFSAISLKVKSSSSFPSSFALKVNEVSVEVKILVEPVFMDPVVAETGGSSERHLVLPTVERITAVVGEKKSEGEAARFGNKDRRKKFGPTLRPTDKVVESKPLEIERNSFGPQVGPNYFTWDERVDPSPLSYIPNFPPVTTSHSGQADETFLNERAAVENRSDALVNSEVVVDQGGGEESSEEEDECMDVNEEEQIMSEKVLEEEIASKG